MIEIAPIVLSFIAIGLSLFVFMEGRRRYKRELFLKIHEIMISEDSYRGRQLLLSREFDDASIEGLPSGERADISRTLALYDTLGLYLRRNHLVEDDVRSMWGDPARRAWRAAQPFVKRRARQAPDQPAYPHFQYLAGRFESPRERDGTSGGDASG
jgi:hypothetical protein